MDEGQDGHRIRHTYETKGQSVRHTSVTGQDIVFDKSIFSNIFYKDIRRVYIYKKAERLASALYLVTPALRDSLSLRAKVESIAVRLTEAARLPGTQLAESVSRELLALSSLLTMARAGGLLSPMNADLITSEARALLGEVTLYEEPRLALEEPETLAALARQAPSMRPPRALPPAGARASTVPRRDAAQGQSQRHVSSRQESIMSFIREKGSVSVKDLSAVVRGVSEKTIQRELQALIEAGQVVKRGERRWSTYAAH